MYYSHCSFVHVHVRSQRLVFWCCLLHTVRTTESSCIANTIQYNTVARGTKKEKITRKNQRAVPATVSMTARNTNNTNISHTRITSRNDLRYDTASHPTPSKVRCDCCTINSEGLQRNTTLLHTRPCKTQGFIFECINK